MDLNLLAFLPELKISNLNPDPDIWDPCRKKWVALTPEEMVRQLFIAYLVGHRGFSLNRIGVEKAIKLEKTKKRFDLIVYTPELRPYILVECKAPDVTLDESVISQVVRYNRVMTAMFLVVVNGHDCRIFDGTPANWMERDSFPPLLV